MCLNCPEAISPPQSVEKLSSTKSISCAKKIGDHGCRGPSEKDKAHSWQLPSQTWGRRKTSQCEGDTVPPPPRPSQ